MFAFFDLLSGLVTWWLRHQRFLSSLPQFFRCTCLFAPSEIFAALTDFMRSNLFQVVPSCAEAGAVCCCQMGVWRQKGNSQRHHKGLVQLLGIENLQTSALVKAVKGSGRTCIDRPHLVVAKVASCPHVPHVSSPVSHVEKCKSSTRFRNGEDSEREDSEKTRSWGYVQDSKSRSRRLQGVHDAMLKSLLGEAWRFFSDGMHQIRFNCMIILESYGYLRHPKTS
jgi:hypothetical protein